ncbi:uncharacterized protein LOC122258417 [Penaeus japonicus]|uniref:uncharacterized protein LOC122258417 n=1 Tax=Penaeus japonicus TaxID=27405 RepID=UPI001C70D886|nr:uncharacterized protein LOC122258417 [Penaeus japonicus]XP_042880290.1 uncharacterized protein LOC122258417 [Penaeus japonicus]
MSHMSVVYPVAEIVRSPEPRPSWAPDVIIESPEQPSNIRSNETLEVELIGDPEELPDDPTELLEESQATGPNNRYTCHDSCYANPSQNTRDHKNMETANWKRTACLQNETNASGNEANF